MVPSLPELSKFGPAEFFCWCLTTPAPAVRLGFRIRGAEPCVPSLCLHTRATMAGPELLGRFVTSSGRPFFGPGGPVLSVDSLTEPEAAAIGLALPLALAELEPGELGRARIRAGARMADVLGHVLGQCEPKDLPGYFGRPILELTRLHWEAWIAARTVFQQ